MVELGFCLFVLVLWYYLIHSFSFKNCFSAADISGLHACPDVCNSWSQLFSNLTLN